MILEGNVGENAHGAGDVRRDEAFRVTEMPRRGANYTHHQILSRSSMSFVSSHAIDIAGDTRRKIKRRYRNGYACPSHVPYRELGRVDLKLGIEIFDCRVESQKQKGIKNYRKERTATTVAQLQTKLSSLSVYSWGMKIQTATRKNVIMLKVEKNNGIHQDLFPTQLGRFNSGAWRRTRVLYTRKRGVDKRLRRDIHSAHRRVTESRANAVQGILSNHITNCRVKSIPVTKKEIVERNEEFDSDDEQYYDENQSSDDKIASQSKSNGTREAMKTRVDSENSDLVHNTHQPFHETHAKDLRSSHFEEENHLENDVDILRKKNDKIGNKEEYL